MPQCSACERQGEVCNITEYVAYPYALVESLHSKVQELEEKLAAYTNGSTHGPSPNGPTPGPYSNRQPTVGESVPADVSKEAEEVGVLAIGFADRYSHSKYGNILKSSQGTPRSMQLTGIPSGSCCWFNLCSNIFQTSWYDQFLGEPRKSRE